jgi:hypothetical protein
VLRFFILALAACAPSLVLAQAKLDASKPVRLEYESKSWNKDSNQEDRGTIFMRDARTNKFAQIELIESGPDTNIFVGSYTVSWGETDFIPEVYIPPASMMLTSDQIRKVENFIKQGVLLRKPYFAHADAKNNQVITVFDTKEQALEALEQYRQLRLQMKTTADRAAMEAQAKAAADRENKTLDQNAQKINADRLRMRADEIKRREELLKNFLALAKSEQLHRSNIGSDLSKNASDFFSQGKFSEAEAEYRKASDMDPTNKNTYLRYGVSLSRNGKFLYSLVVLDLAEGTDSALVERDFYLALNLWSLKDNSSALKGFENVKAKKDKNFSATSAFYIGLIKFQREEYEAAKPEFEYVLDNSSDPAFDKQAETYIEAIANAQAFKKEQQKRFFVTLSGGLIYDSNILSVANSQLNQPTDLMGYRWTYGGSLEYRPYYTTQNEFSIILAASDMYSTDTKFKAMQTFQNTDPLVYSLYFPFKYKGKAFDKGYLMTLSPGVEAIQMNSDGTGGRETIMNSTVLKNDNTLIMRDDWFATYSLELRNDKSSIDTTSTPEEDLTAQKVTLSTAQTFFQNQKKTEAWIAELGASQNNAKGENAYYTRFDIAATYLAPWKWDTVWTGRLAYYDANYSKHLTGRHDMDTSLTLGLSKPLTERLTANLSGTYIINQSTLESSDYNKYMIMTTFSWTAFR